MNVLVDQGWRYVPAPSAHGKLFPPDVEAGSTIVSGSPSDWRARRNWLSQLQRMGARVDSNGNSTDRTVRRPSQAAAMPTTTDRPDISPISTVGWWWHPAPVEEPEPVLARPQLVPPPPNPDDAKGEHWNLGQARALLRQGYHVSKVVRKTGWGRNWLSDLVDPATGYLRMGADRAV